MPRSASPDSLTSEQRAEADRISTALVAAADEDILALANQMASTTDATLFGENEFTLRDIVLRVAAKGLEIAQEMRKKGGTKGRVEAASSAVSGPTAATWPSGKGKRTARRLRGSRRLSCTQTPTPAGKTAAATRRCGS